MNPEKRSTARRGSFLPETAQRRLRLPRDPTLHQRDPLGDALRARGIPVDDAQQKRSFLLGLLARR